MDHYDIVVIGAGPAGCMFVHQLDKDFRVLVVERQSLPARKICGGLLTEESIDFLASHQLTLPSYVYSRPKQLKKMYVYVDKNLETDGGSVYNIDRNQFNRWMWSLIENKAEVVDQTSLKKITHQKKTTVLRLHNHHKNQDIDVSCEYLIGADGVLSRVRRQIQAPVANKYLAIQEYGQCTGNVDQLRLLFTKSFIDHFIWVMPKGEVTVFGLPFPYIPSQRVDFDKMKQAQDLVEKNMKITIDCQHRDGFLVTIPKSLEELSLGKNNTLLIGEAAGWISPRSGDGISFALRSSSACAEAFNTDASSALQKYSNNVQDLREEFIEKLESFLQIQQRIHDYKKKHGL